MPRPVAIVGAGLSGLSCALHLHRHGVPVRLFEASNDFGGRIRTDEHRGFLIDRGFQTLDTSYPEVQRMLDFKALELSAFERTLTVPIAGKLRTIEAPRLRVDRLLPLMRLPIGTRRDKLRALWLAHALRRATPPSLLTKRERSANDYLKNLRFSPDFEKHLVRPLFRTVLQEHRLDSSSRWLELLLHFALTGNSTLPARGMQEIPRQIAAQLPGDIVHLGTAVRTIANRSIVLTSGETVLCGATVLATSELVAAQFLGEQLPDHRAGHSVHHLSYGVPVAHAPSLPPGILLGTPGGNISSLTIPSLVAASYAPKGMHLVSVTVLPFPQADRIPLEVKCHGELTRFFGNSVDHWQLLDHQRIDDAFPPQPSEDFLTPRGLEVSPGIYRCGDYLESGSIQGALVSGRKTAALVRRQLDD